MATEALDVEGEATNQCEVVDAGAAKKTMPGRVRPGPVG